MNLDVYWVLNIVNARKSHVMCTHTHTYILSIIKSAPRLFSELFHKIIVHYFFRLVYIYNIIYIFLYNN